MQSTAQMRDKTGAPARTNSNDRCETGRRELTVRDVMSKDVLTVVPEETLSQAARRMSENNVSCLIVMDGGHITGILAEKDVLNGIARREPDFRHVRVADRMSRPVETVAAGASIIQASRIMESLNVKRLPVIENGRLVGIVSQTDITRGLVSLCPLRAVSDIMTAQLATVQADTSVAEAARLMASQGISCVVALHRQDAAGILTEKDLLERVVALQKDPEQTPVADVMSFPIIAVPPNYSVLSASKKLDNFHLHRLVVTDGNRVCGIVTQTDLMRAIRNELDRMEAERCKLAVELSALVHRVGEESQDRYESSGAAGTVQSGREATGALDVYGHPPADTNHGAASRS